MVHIWGAGQVLSNLNGKILGRQRYCCKDCNYHFSRTSPRGVPLEKKLLALRLYKEGLGFRSIGRVIGVSNVAVLKWVRETGKVLRERVLAQTPQDAEGIEIIEIDEMWHFTKKNSKNYGYGLLYLVPHDESLPLKLALVAPSPLKDCGQDFAT